MLDILIHSKRNEKLQQETEGVRTPPIGIDNPSFLAASAPARAFLASASAKSRRPPSAPRQVAHFIHPTVSHSGGSDRNRRHRRRLRNRIFIMAERANNIQREGRQKYADDPKRARACTAWIWHASCAEKAMTMRGQDSGKRYGETLWSVITIQKSLMA